MEDKSVGESSTISTNLSVSLEKKSPPTNGNIGDLPPRSDSKLNLNGGAGQLQAKPSISHIARGGSAGPADFNNDSNDDVGWWNCSLCTYKNSADRFKCEICDLKRGSSTRKPRCNADTIVAQVVRQQEQIRQQTRVTKPTPKSRPQSSTNQASPTTQPTSSNSSLPKSKKPQSKEASDKSKNTKSSNSHKNEIKNHELDCHSGEEYEMESDGSPKSKRKKTLHKSKKIDHPGLGGGDELTDAESTDVSEDSSNAPSHRSSSPEESESDSCHPEFSSIYDNSDAASSPEPENQPSEQAPVSSESVNRTVPLEVNGGLIKYSPPTSSGRTGLIIDKKKFTQHSVTVDDVTITFTEFATRRNNYVRKKKRRRDRGN